MDEPLTRMNNGVMCESVPYQGGAASGAKIYPIILALRKQDERYPANVRAAEDVCAHCDRNMNADGNCDCNGGVTGSRIWEPVEWAGVIKLATN